MFASYQEAFDATVMHLAQQGKRSYDPTPGAANCVYRMKEDDKVLMCAVGCHIQDIYTPDLEGVNVVGLPSSVMQKLKIKQASEKNSEAFWARLQNTHDTNTTVHGVKFDLQNIAVDYGLDSRCIEQITEWS